MALELLLLLEFRNGMEIEDTFRIPSILVVCPAQAERLMELKESGAVFGVSALVRKEPWICAPVGKSFRPVEPHVPGNCGKCRYCIERRGWPVSPHRPSRPLPEGRNVRPRHDLRPEIGRVAI